MALTPTSCPQCGRPIVGGLCAGVCAQCMAASMLGEWGEDMAEVASAPDEMIITRVSDYDVLRVIGRGGMGVVCRARDRLLGRDVALKLMHSGVLASDEELRRFRTEAEAVARLRHPNLVSIYEAGDADGQAYYTMSIAEGGTLAQRLADNGVMPPRDAAALIECIAHAIHHAHTRGVLHRDLKPANIVFDASGTPMVSDFGLARVTGEVSATRSGALIGTPAYIAPEVASGIAGHTTSSDVYALGVILYECLTGKPPFENDSPLALLKIITEQDPPAPSALVKGIDSDLEAVCLHALDKDPSRRYSSAEAFAQDLRHWLEGEAVSARPPLFWERFWRWAHLYQSRAILYTMAAVSLLILILASAVMNVLLAQEQSRLADARQRSEIRRAGLLRDFASRLMKTADAIPDARSYLIEAAAAGTGSIAEDHAIGLRVRVIDRLADTVSKPLPAWKGEGLKRVWFDMSGTLHLQTSNETLELDSQGKISPSKALPPERVLGSSAFIEIQQPRSLRVWASPERKSALTSLLDAGSQVLDAQLSPDSRYLAATTANNELHVWEIATSLTVTPPIAVRLAGHHLVWNPARHQLAVWNERELVWFDW